jgi:hypothetical protein
LNRSITRILLFLSLLLVAAGLGDWIVHARRSSDLAKRVFGGSEAFHAFVSCSAITVQRLHCNQTPGSWALSDYTREAPIRLSQPQVRELKRVFTDRALYSPSLWTLSPELREITPCGPPSYAVVFTAQSRQTVQIALCFRCEQFGVFVGDNRGAVNWSDRLAFMQPLLVTLVKPMYPSDAQIQAIKREDWLELSRAEHTDLTRRWRQAMTGCKSFRPHF